MRAAIEQARILRCSLYDGFSAGLASLLDVTLYSADAMAHGAFPGVVLIGQE